jgi:hypothetical protein
MQNFESAINLQNNNCTRVDWKFFGLRKIPLFTIHECVDSLLSICILNFNEPPDRQLPFPYFNYSESFSIFRQLCLNFNCFQIDFEIQTTKLIICTERRFKKIISCAIQQINQSLNKKENIYVYDQQCYLYFLHCLSLQTR